MTNWLSVIFCLSPKLVTCLSPILVKHPITKPPYLCTAKLNKICNDERNNRKQAHRRKQGKAELRLYNGVFYRNKKGKSGFLKKNEKKIFL